MVISFVGPTLIEINPQTLFDGNGDVTKWVTLRTAALSRRAKKEAPHGGDSGRINKSSANPEEFGALRKGTRASKNMQPGPLQFQITLESTVRYSLYVIKGTKSPITAKLARNPAGTRDAFGNAIGGQFVEGRRGMFLPPNPGFGKGGIPTQQVRGQRANDFLSRAVNREAQLHPALRGYSPD